MKRMAKFKKVDIVEFVNCMKTNFLIDDDKITDIYNSIKLPTRSTIGSAGYDFFAPNDFTLKAKESILIPTGIRVKIDEGWFLSILPKSGLGCKYRLQLDNTVGVIDSDYYYSDNQGHIMVKITNDSNENKVLGVKKGMSFCQGVFMAFGITSDDDASQIRNGGFGSTSK